MNPENEYRGGCGCGSLRYRITEAPSSCCICHCASCRKATGAAFVAWATFGAAAFDLTGTGMRLHRSSAQVRRGFCERCGTPMTYTHDERPNQFDLAVSTLDDPELLPPGYHIWVADKLSWVAIGDNLPQFSGWRTTG